MSEPPKDAKPVDQQQRELTRLRNELAAFRAECDKVGVPYDPAGLVRHHRGNAALTAETNRLAQELLLGRALTVLTAVEDYLTSPATPTGASYLTDAVGKTAEWQQGAEQVATRIRELLEPVTLIRERAKEHRPEP